MDRYDWLRMIYFNEDHQDNEIIVLDFMEFKCFGFIIELFAFVNELDGVDIFLFFSGDLHF